LPALFQRIHEKASPIVATKVNLPHESVIMEKEKVEEIEYEIKKEIERACSDEYRLGGKKAYQRIVGVIVNKLMPFKGEALSIFDIKAVRESSKFRKGVKKQLSKLNQVIKDIAKRDETLGGHIKTAIMDFVRKVKGLLSEDPIKLMPLSKKNKDKYVDVMCSKIKEITSSVPEIRINKLSDKVIVKIMGARGNTEMWYKKEEWNKGKYKGLESKLDEVSKILSSAKTTLESACKSSKSKNRLPLLPNEIHNVLKEILSRNKQYDVCDNIEGAWYYGGLQELFETIVKYVSGIAPGSEIDSIELVLK
jgi:hypothetical protein